MRPSRAATGRSSGYLSKVCGPLLLPTPMSGGADPGKRGARGLDGSSWARERVARLLPTPRSAYGGPEMEKATRNGRKTGVNLATAVRLLPTPTKRDWKSSAASPETMGRNARPLNETARASGIAGTAATLLTLVEWMLGYPPNHLNRAALPAPASLRMATASSRKSPKRSV